MAATNANKERVRKARSNVYTDTDAVAFDKMVEKTGSEQEVQDLIAEDKARFKGTRKQRDANNKKYPREKDL
jgi:hypothetical protein